MPPFETDTRKNNHPPTVELDDSAPDFFLDFRLGFSMDSPPPVGDSLPAPAAAKPDAASLPASELPHSVQMVQEGSRENIANVVKDDSGKITSITDNEGSTTTLRYDKQGRMTRAMNVNKEGEVQSMETVRYNDAAGTRVRASLAYDFEGGITDLRETHERFEDGKLREHIERDSFQVTNSLFDAKGREVAQTQRDPNNGELLLATDREFFADGSFKVKSSKFDDGFIVGQSIAIFDKDENPIGLQFDSRYDKDGNETMRKESSHNPGQENVSRLFENGVLTKEVSKTLVKSERDRAGSTQISETKLGPNGEVVESIDAKFFPRQPFLPTQIVVKGADGQPSRTVDIEYATKGASDRLETHGPVARIKSLSVTTAEGTTKTEFAKPNEQIRAWNDFFKATKNIDATSIPMGRPAKDSQLGPGVEWPPKGRTSDEASLKPVAA